MSDDWEGLAIAALGAGPPYFELDEHRVHRAYDIIEKLRPIFALRYTKAQLESVYRSGYRNGRSDADDGERLKGIAAAAAALVAAMDEELGTGWRAETLGQGARR